MIWVFKYPFQKVFSLKTLTALVLGAVNGDLKPNSIYGKNATKIYKPAYLTNPGSKFQRNGNNPTRRKAEIDILVG